MTPKVIVGVALFIMAAVALVYGLYFGLYLGYSLSDKPEVWSQLGGYFGGILGPILSFFSIVLLISSLRLQNQANTQLKSEIQRNKKNEEIKQFEVKLFNLIDSQKVVFSNFELEFIVEGENVVKRSSKAMNELEDIIDECNDHSVGPEDKKKLLESLDSCDDIFSLVRVFYVIVKIICDTFDENTEGNKLLRKEYILTLVNFTDYSALKLIIISMKYSDFANCRYLVGCEDFIDVINGAGLRDYYRDI